MKHLHLLPLALAAAAALAPNASAQTFVQRASELGLNHSFMCGVDRVGSLPPMCDWSQIGVALGDLDGDGDQDVIALGRLMPNHVFRNDGASFTDVTPALFNNGELDSSVALGDYDRDGDLDVYIGVNRAAAGILRSPNRLLRNEGGFQFTDVTGLSGLAGNGHTIAAKWFDLDRDGWLDLYHSEFNGVANRLHRNMGDGTFSDVTAAIGAGALGSTHVSAIADLDGNGTWEILIGNDWKVSNSAGFEPNKDEIFYTRQADGTWLDVTVGAGWDLAGAPAFGSSTMGIALGDYDCDGDFDAYRTEVGPQFMHRNEGWPASGLPWVSQGDFLGVTNSTSLTPTGSGPTVGWYATFGHFDFDEWLDLWKANGHVSSSNPRNQQDYLWTSDGPTNSFKFTDRTIAYGLQDFFDDRGAAVGDVDGDLDLDMLVAPPGGSLRYWENQLDKTGKGTIAIKPVTGSSAPEGIGTVVRWTDPAGFEHSLQIGGNGATASDDQHFALFGVGANAAADIRLEYPSGMIQTVTGVAANSLITPEEPEMIRLSEIKGAVATGGGPLLRGSLNPTSSGGKKGPGTKPNDPGDSVSVTVWAYDRTGAPVNNPAQVDVSVAGLTATSVLTPVTPGGNQFRRWFARPTTAGEYAVSATFAGWTPNLHPTFKFFGAASSAKGTIHVDVAGVRVSSADTFRVVYVPKDANGIALGAGNDVRLQMGSDIALTSLTDNGDGSYSKTFNAPTVAGSKSIDIQVNGSLFTGLKSLDVASTPSSTGTLVYSETPNSGFALFPHQYKFTITPRDISGRKLGPKTGMECTVTTTSGPTLSVRTDLVPNGTADGEFWFVIEKPIGSGASSGIATVKADGITVKTVVISY